MLISLERIVLCARCTTTTTTERWNYGNVFREQKRSGISSNRWHRQVDLCSSTMAMVFISSSSTDFSQRNQIIFWHPLLSLFGLTGIPVCCVRCFVEPIVFWPFSVRKSPICVLRSYWISTAEQRREDGRIPEEYGERGETGTQSKKAIRW